MPCPSSYLLYFFGAKAKGSPWPGMPGVIAMLHHVAMLLSHVASWEFG